MKAVTILLSGFMILVISCNKSGGNVYPEPLTSQIKATISINGGSTTTINPTGSGTSFRRTTGANGDIITSIIGTEGNKQIGLFLVNITVPGTYTFSNSSTGQRAFCSYSVGSMIFSTGVPPPPTGSIIITEFTSTSIKGVFSALVLNVAEIVTISNGSFEGTIF